MSLNGLARLTLQVSSFDRRAFQTTICSMARFDVVADLSVLSTDSRGWPILEVAANPMNVVFNVKMPVKNNSFKKLEIVSQETPLRVYVNPEFDEPDEWEHPAGSGQVFRVASFAWSES